MGDRHFRNITPKKSTPHPAPPNPTCLLTATHRKLICRISWKHLKLSDLGQNSIGMGGLPRRSAPPSAPARHCELSISLCAMAGTLRAFQLSLSAMAGIELTEQSSICSDGIRWWHWMFFGWSCSYRDARFVALWRRRKRSEKQHTESRLFLSPLNCARARARTPTHTHTHTHSLSLSLSLSLSRFVFVALWQ